MYVVYIMLCALSTDLATTSNLWKALRKAESVFLVQIHRDQSPCWVRVEQTDAPGSKLLEAAKRICRGKSCPCCPCPQLCSELAPPVLGHRQDLAGLGVGLQGSLALPVCRRWRETHQSAHKTLFPFQLGSSKIQFCSYAAEK